MPRPTGAPTGAMDGCGFKTGRETLSRPRRSGTGAMMEQGTDASQEVVKRRMESVRKAERRGDVSINLKLVRDEMLSSVPALHRLLSPWGWSLRLRDFVAQAGMKTKPAKILLVSGVIALALYLIAGLYFPRFPIPWLVGIFA